MSRDPDQIETMAAPASAITPSHARKERFAPGTLLASRFRIVSILGKGGMGEVFRADDLILGQPVALKFLPESAKSNVSLLTRFYDEVRIARQISHKNVCRVYDIGEVDGQPYLSMEYIDGEDLGSLLRRIGRLPADKATEFARKLCAAVAAAHAQGVLHRDLKPANIMIDSRGELRVTDFGLATITEQLHPAEIRNGTPAYMAPEQLAGTEVSSQSDLYAVGLILYEMFTGKLPLQADTIAEITHLRQSSQPAKPSTLIGDLDKTVERAILRCLEPDPKMRPASALALSASLPGGDPLAAALAEGVTPSPEIVAAAGPAEGLSPKVAIAALVGIAVGMMVFCFTSPHVHLMNLVPLENPPEVLTAKARDIVRSLGYTERPADWTSGFADSGNFAFLQSKGRNMEEWAHVFQQSPSAIAFWYRQAPMPLATQRISSNGQASLTDPPVTVPGMLTVTMDLDGSLRRFIAVPPEHEAPPDGATALEDWAPLFSAARLDPSKMTPVAPEWSPPVATDTRAAWTGFYGDRSDLPVRVEAAAFHRRPVHFQVFWPWKTNRSTPAVPTGSQTLRSFANYALGAIVLIVALGIAYYNWRAGRGDIRGATRVGIYCAGMSLVAWIFDAHHVASSAEQGLIESALANAAYICLEYWLIYLALEPWVRRYWPQTMITWSRVLAGKWRDPLVGRDLLFGIFLGIVYALLMVVYEYANLRSGAPVMGGFGLAHLDGFHTFAGSIARLSFGEVSGSLLLLLTLFLVRVLLKKQWLVALVWVVGWVAVRFMRSNFSDSSALKITTGVFWLVLFTMLVLIMLRLGFFALVVAIFVLDSMAGTFLTTDFSAWYGQSSMAIAILIAAMALWGFRLSLGSGPLFSPTVLEKT